MVPLQAVVMPYLGEFTLADAYAFNAKVSRIKSAEGVVVSNEGLSGDAKKLVQDEMGPQRARITDPFRITGCNPRPADVVERVGPDLVEPELLRHLQRLPTHLNRALVSICEHVVAGDLGEDPRVNARRRSSRNQRPGIVEMFGQAVSAAPVPAEIREHERRLCGCLAQLLVSLCHLQPDLDTRLAFLTQLVHLMCAGRHGEVVLCGSDLRLA